MKEVVALLINMNPGNQQDNESESTQQPMSIRTLLGDGFQAARDKHLSSSKTFAIFFSHHKVACAAEVRLVKQNYEELLLGVKCFLGRCLQSYHTILDYSLVD